MPLILNIETSSPICSVCLAKNGAAIDFREDRQGNSHAKVLTVFIDELFKENNFSFSELDAVAVSSGPGSYTGLRIGTSVAKGLCYALGKPLIAVPTLLALAYAMQQKENSPVHYLPVMDARRMDVYTALYDSAVTEIIPTGCFTLNEEFEKSLSQFPKIIVGGNAVAKCQSFFTTPVFYFMEDINCDARHLVQIAEKKHIKNEFENLGWFQPNYLKEFSSTNQHR